ncbi:MAG: hypothetical protein IPP71_13475 [Bacteroidetes bacterium]|nr:hypothetical protein [Bacteroidota bacterium]
MKILIHNFLAFILSISILGGVIHMDEIGKIPMLFKHFSEHKALHQNDTVFDFLYKHYISIQKADSEKDKNSNTQLPFKSNKKLVSHYFPFIFENKSVQYNLIPFIKRYVLFHKVKSIAGFSAIWQPPKIG